MKKVCLISYDMSLAGGAERVLANLANCLSTHFKIFVISIVSSKKKCCFKLEENIIYDVILDSNKRVRYNLIKGSCKLYQYLTKNKIDVVISFNLTLSLFLINSFLDKNIKIIITIHTSTANIFYKSLKEKICKKIGVVFADKIITLTQRDKVEYIKKYYIKNNKIEQIYNFVDEKIIKYQNNYNQHSKIILSVGRFDKVKGYEMLVRIAQKIFAKYADWKWYIYGDGDQVYLRKIKHMITLYNLESHILLKGGNKEIYSVYEEAAIFVLTSYFEGLPMVLLEAKANWLPTVAFDCPTGPKEIIDHEISGFLIEAYNEDMMAKKISELIENKNMRLKFSLRAQDNLHKFQQKIILNKWIKVIEEL